jgi:hypothetical protein
MPRVRLPSGSILGTFSKGITGSLSVNFGLSGGTNCDTRCKHHPESTAADATHACYAVRNEKFYPSVLRKLTRHETMPPALLCGRAIIEIQARIDAGKPIPWLRVSTNGAVPMPAQARADKLFCSQFRALITLCRQHDIPVHFPVESYEKQRFYAALLGDLATVRESAQTDRRFLSAKTPVATTARKGANRVETVDNARMLARKRREKTGRKTVVCPAVLNTFAARKDPSKRNDRAKCGACVACADALVDIVYPCH